MKRLCYLGNIRIPTEKAHGVQIFKMCEAFTAAGCKVTLAVSNRRSVISEEPFAYYGAPYSFDLVRISSLDLNLVRFGRAGFLLQSFTFAWSTLWYLRRTRPDIVFTREPLVVLAAHVVGIPTIIWEVHTAAWNLFARLASSRAHTLIAISKGLMDFYIGHGVPREHVLLAHDGVDLKDFANTPTRAVMRERLNLPAERNILEYVGKLKTMGEGKGVEELLEAVGVLLPSHPQLFLLLVGLNEDEIDEADALAKHAGLATSDYRFVQHIPHTEVAGYLRAADILVMNYPNTPHYARMMSPLKLFEYMASGTAILTSDLPTIREALTERTAYFVEPDSQDSLQTGIVYLSEHSELREALAAAAQEESLGHTWHARALRILASDGSVIKSGIPSDTTLDDVNDSALWKDALLDQAPPLDAQRIALESPRTNTSGARHLYARMVLWQLNDPTYGLRPMRVVRNDVRLAAFCDELSDLYRRESIGEKVAPQIFEDLFERMQAVWSVVGIQKKRSLGRLTYRLAWIGGKQIAQLLVGGWFEAWIWALAACRMRGSGQTSVLVWSWVRAGGTKDSAAYTRRMNALADQFVKTISP
jgi:glycosyltransferase involved in cell wall biosynthesis